MTVTTQGFLGFDEDEIERLAAEVHILAEASEFERLHPRGRTGEFVRTLRHVIAVDGPAASGKSTVARALAARRRCAVGASAPTARPSRSTARMSRTRSVRLR
jgi:pantothenate kinase